MWSVNSKKIKISRRANVEDCLNRFSAGSTGQSNDANDLLDMDFLTRESEANFDEKSCFPIKQYWP